MRAPGLRVPCILATAAYRSTQSYRRSCTQAMVDQIGRVLTSRCTAITSPGQQRSPAAGSVALNQATRSNYDFRGGGTGFGFGGFDGGYGDRAGDTDE